MSRIPVWFDTDIGVDDAAALLVLGKVRDVEIVGVSAVVGNVILDNSYANARKVAHLMGLDCPVYRGADRPLLKPLRMAAFIHGVDGLGGAELPPSPAPETEEPAWDALYRAAEAEQGELQVIAVGPLTNLAIAFAKYPDLKDRLKRILIMGGSGRQGNMTPAAEVNMWADPHAAQAVFQSGVPIVMCGLDVTNRVCLTEEEVQAVIGHDSPVCRFFRAATGLLRNGGGLWLHDICPVVYLAHPEYFSGREAGVAVETRGTITNGKTVTDLWSAAKFPKKNAFVVLEADRAAYGAYVRDALLQY